MSNTPSVKTVLILAANPTDTSRLRLDQEVREIEEGLKRAPKGGNFRVVQKWAVRSRDFYRAILEHKPQIVHFCGHGAGVDGIVLEDDTGQPTFVDQAALSKLFKLFAVKGVECVVLNACYSKEQAEAISQYIKYVIGMNQAIGDKAAITFAVAFYDALGAGEAVDFAFNLGCSQLVGLKEDQTPVLKTTSIRPADIQFEAGDIPPNPYLGLSAFGPKHELDEQDIETLRELLQLSGRAAVDRRKALCIEIGINSGDLSAIFMLSENDFAVELIDLLHRRKLESSIYRLCKKLVSDFQHGAYHSKLEVIMIKISP
ncbi:CHAT domain-containing protein [Aetokthonos hydrillicola Thurmond2011]|jgi:hypothetical protein|uniref:CHAT domain-containing protein n=1 Tax=Aetokthonos hydrillicola Thurmond2011 TaxID=2712845 RepID=A0AAP5MDP9_9CYAN|nr:CHAT domain-containing protein [Aetokthonos hydrillicola]MBO3463026.1 hypothetical protein [Aetokthonos hydrillicola CCALA 1050]MBW4590843.1 CHAT domain-containing protein [Aetokthonos hydrillicola CCALA 1050]MDR9900872.1 CHAT domain-containing protein [Aetokthonos hydrillicola Thurmond2011]